MNYLEIIEKVIDKSLENIIPDGVNFSVEIPELLHGDATCNVCLIAAKALGKSPQEVANLIIPKLEKSLGDIVEKIEFKNPGFINFYLNREYIQKILMNTNFKRHGKNKKWYEFWKKQNKILVEFTSVNLFKPFTIGHLMSNFTGEYISRSLESQGNKVLRLSYPSDISIGIAKAIWVIKKEGGLKQEIFNQSKNEIVKYLGQSYVKGVSEFKKFEEGNNTEEIAEIKQITNNLYKNSKNEDLEIFKFTKKINIEYFQKMIESLGTKFDGFIYESEAGEWGKKIVLENIPKVFQKSEGAIIYTPDESRKDINISVFINSEGNPTYLAKDIGLLYLKFKKYSPFEKSIYVVDNEQNAHFKSVFDAAGKIDEEWQEKSVHVSHGRMTFKGQKMSSRLGGVPSGEEVINAVLEDVRERAQRANTNVEERGEREKNEKINLEIALSALRICILRSKPGVNIDFDPEKASSFEGDSGPYLCYTHARCCSLLEKGKEFTKKISTNSANQNVTNLERKVLQYSYILSTATNEIAPQKLVKYLFELAGEFNTFYANNKIILENKNKEEILQTQHNLYLTKITRETLKRGLYILGINAPEKM